MNCTNVGCPGEYQRKYILHTVRYKDRVVVIDRVPAEVCSVCGDTLLTPDTVRHIEKLLDSASQPQSTAPVYEYA